MSTDMMRMAAMMALAEKHGCTPDVAARAALAMHPMDDSKVPGRRFEKAVRKRSRGFSKSIRRLSGDSGAIDAAARDALSEYRRLAKDLGESQYISRYDQTLGLDQAS